MAPKHQSSKLIPRFVNKAAIARQLGISRPYVSMLLSGERNNEEQLYRIKQLIKQQLKAA